MTSSNTSLPRNRSRKPNRLFIEVIGRYDWLFEKLVDFGEKHGTACHYIIVPSLSLKYKYQSLLKHKDSMVITIAELDAELEGIQFPVEYDIIEAAAQLEISFGYRYLRDLMQQDRSVWATKVPFAAPTWGNVGDVDDISVYDRINRGFIFLESVFKKFQPKMLLVRPGSVLTNIAISIAEKNSVPCTMPRPARHNSFVTWTLGPYSHSAQLKNLFDDDAIDVPTVLIDDINAPDGSMQVFARFQNSYGFRGLLRRFLIETYNHAHSLCRAISRGNVNSRARYLIFLNRFSLEIRSIEFLRKIWVNDAKSLPGKKLLFLLPKEPEYTVQSLGRDFNNIHAMLAHLSTSLPVGVTLLIKEHSRVGYRKLEFYKELTRYSNVKFVNPFLPSKHFLKDCDAAATVAGTIALECCAEGKKCLTFTDKMEYNFLPNVVYAHNLYKLCGIVDVLLEKPKASDIAIYKKAASRYYAILERTSFSAPGTKVFEGTDSISDASLKRAWELLCLNYQYQLDN
tara:strand:- start:1188 stop:2723 length:1536 start_codon:yes stop_codon:yes gene_type:complete